MVEPDIMHLAHVGTVVLAAFLAVSVLGVAVGRVTP
jgi:hypothetical protein